MLHRSDTQYNTKPQKKPNHALQKLVMEFAIDGCKKHDGLAQVGTTNIWIVDADRYEVVRK
jgi:hypothetical protein